MVVSGGDTSSVGRVLERLSSFKRSMEATSSSESSVSRRAELEGLEGSAQNALARLAEEQQVSTRLLHTINSICLLLSNRL